MIGLITSIIIFNFVAFKTNKRLTKNQIVHIWSFCFGFQQCFDVFINFKYHGYWYFSHQIDWAGLLPYLLLTPAAAVVFLSHYPLTASLRKRVIYVFLWTVGIVIYEWLALLPEPWGFFNYGWWTVWHAIIIDPILFFILIKYYRWIYKLEREVAEE